MSYSLYTPTGSEHAVVPISVPDNAIDQALYDSVNKLGVQFVGRNAVDYGTATAQNFLQLTSNFAGTILPNDTLSQQGQLWFNATSTTAGTLYVKIAAGVGLGAGILNWRKVATIADPGDVTGYDGQIRVVGSVISIWAGGVWNQVFPAVYS